MASALVLARGPALADERYVHPAALVARLRELAAGAALDFAVSYLPRAQRPAGHGVACRAACGAVLGYAFPPFRGEAEVQLDVSNLQADLALAFLRGEAAPLRAPPSRRTPFRVAA